MFCSVCGRNKLTTAYRINGKKFSVCSECLKELRYKIMEVCSVCGEKTLVDTDIKGDVPRAIICPCGQCM